MLQSSVDIALWGSVMLSVFDNAFVDDSVPSVIEKKLCIAD